MKNINLPVPYLSQRDNTIYPSSSCNMTSLAMCLKYYGIVGHGRYPQLEDELTAYAIKKGIQPTTVEGIKTIAGDYGVNDDVKTTASMTDIDSSLIRKHPVIIHGYFTQSGHIVVIKGFDNDKYIVHDPWGDLSVITWMYENTDGENVIFYKRTLIAICSAYSLNEAKENYYNQSFNEKSVSNMWIHEIYK